MTNAAGKVTVGFSEPWVALYACPSGTVQFSKQQKLARGVSISIEPETSEGSNFYADNQVAETSGAKFTGGKTTLTVDGLFMTAEALIMGTPEAGVDGWTAYGDKAKAPYVSLGFIVKSLSNGNELYTPMILLKNKFDQIKTSAKTEEGEQDYQAQELTATTMRSDNTEHDWKWVGADKTTEADALSELKKKLGVMEA